MTGKYQLIFSLIPKISMNFRITIPKITLIFGITDFLAIFAPDLKQVK